jgi:hypothetical protein
MTDVAEPGECQQCLARARKLHVRMWRGLASLEDLTKPPMPLLRSIGIALTGIIYAATGTPTRLGDWLWYAIIGGALLLPSVTVVGFGGFRLELRKAQEDIATLRNEVSSRSSAVVNFTITPEVIENGMRAAFRTVQAEQDPTDVYEPARKTGTPELRDYG